MLGVLLFGWAQLTHLKRCLELGSPGVFLTVGNERQSEMVMILGEIASSARAKYVRAASKSFFLR